MNNTLNSMAIHLLYEYYTELYGSMLTSMNNTLNYMAICLPL